MVSFSLRKRKGGKEETSGRLNIRLAKHDVVLFSPFLSDERNKVFFSGGAFLNSLGDLSNALKAVRWHQLRLALRLLIVQKAWDQCGKQLGAGAMLNHF